MENSMLRIIVHLNISPERLDTFKGMAQDIVSNVEADEPLTNGYEWYISDNGKNCYVAECYQNSDALLNHLENVGDALGPLLDIAPLSEMIVFGSPSDTALEVLSGFGAKIFPLTAGFTR